MGTLFLISTPIGNLKDVTIRALETMSEVDLLLCEDTRETGKLIAAYPDYFVDRKPQLLSYNDHNREQRIPEVVQRLIQGQNVGLVSDRGTPIVSDPGYKLVRAITEMFESEEFDIKLDVIPGASAILPALQLSGFPPDKFYFAGFMPRKKKALADFLTSLPKTTVIVFESPHRLKKSLGVVSEVLGDVPLAVTIEITKMYQEVVKGTPSEVLDHFEKNSLRGEVTLVMDNR